MVKLFPNFSFGGQTSISQRLQVNGYHSNVTGLYALDDHFELSKVKSFSTIKVKHSKKTAHFNRIMFIVCVCLPATKRQHGAFSVFLFKLKYCVYITAFAFGLDRL